MTWPRAPWRHTTGIWALVGCEVRTSEPLRFIDWITIGYLALTAVIAVARLEIRPRAGWVLVSIVLILSLILLLRGPQVGRTGRMLREIYPILMLPALYGGLDLLNGFDIPVRDLTVRGWEQMIFGGQISRTWWQAFPSQFWSTVLHGAYFSFYLIIPLPPIYFLAKGRRDHARTAVTMIAATFLVCYVIFLLFPVAGPYYEFPHPEGPFVENWAARLVYSTLARGSSYGAAFPSSHVAATAAAVLATWAGSRRLALVLAVPTILLTVGVVYCQMHYAVDVLAGAVVPWLLFPIVRRTAS